MSEIRDKVMRNIAAYLAREDYPYRLEEEVGILSKTTPYPERASDILSIPELAIVDTEADLVSAISFNLGLFKGEIGSLFENYPTNFNLIMERLRKVLEEAGWVKEVKD